MNKKLIPTVVIDAALSVSETAPINVSASKSYDEELCCGISKAGEKTTLSTVSASRRHFTVTMLFIGPSINSFPLIRVFHALAHICASPYSARHAALPSHEP